MEEARLAVGNDMTEWIGHCRILPIPAGQAYQNFSRIHAGNYPKDVCPGFSGEDLACAWEELIARNTIPPTHELAMQLIETGVAGILVPSFAPGAPDKSGRADRAVAPRPSRLDQRRNQRRSLIATNQGRARRRTHQAHSKRKTQRLKTAARPAGRLAVQQASSVTPENRRKPG